MELIKAIALLCQITIGVGSGHGGIQSNHQELTFKYVQDLQKTCQKEIAECMLEGRALYTKDFLKCIK